MSKVWFITGASRGFGRVWAEAAAVRGDKVAATARDVATLAEMRESYGDAVLPLALDITDGEKVRQAVAQAHDHFGRLDVIVNNAGYTLVGMTEEADEAQVRALFDTNYFGMLRVIKAALPVLRAQGSGHIIGVSSSLAIAALPLIGFYCATKWAVEALHESLAQEVKPFGIKVTLIEPGAYSTGFAASRKVLDPLDAYNDLRAKIVAGLQNNRGGDPNATAQAILQLVDATEPPLRLAIGNTHGAIATARIVYPQRLATWEAWEAATNAAQGEFA